MQALGHVRQIKIAAYCFADGSQLLKIHGKPFPGQRGKGARQKGTFDSVRRAPHDEIHLWYVLIYAYMRENLIDDS
ncbi:hypothetical protein GCM10027288_46350 [Bordetella tumbae]